ncbi:MAG: class I SAM-dependent RNA methyltransferase [Akkermansiaceae bacterium]|nr:class I SAM-dependent RNA methyltransferase [Akkermansiaceae bacterium]MCP5547490.1 class I SAM-dependent RNA methyltransferase [Akkermansiaceae bacterium]
MHKRPPKKFVAFPFEYHQEIEVAIDSLTNLGAGVGRVDGWVVFVPFALPGETVKARVYRNDKNCSHADLVEVLVPSTDRVEPRCPLFGDCGGCQYQQLAYPRQLEWKSRQVGELMKHMAGIEHPVNPCLSTDQIWNYRSKITPHFERPRDGVISEIGFLAMGSRSRLVDVPRCEIAMDAINDALPGIRDDVRSRAASFRRGSTVLIRAARNGVVTEFDATVTEKVGDLEFKFLARDFFQNNPFILPKFTGYVAERATAGGARFLVDAYCGSGLFALTLARRFEKVRGVEVSESSVEWARRNAEANGIGNAEFLAASAEAIFAGIDFPPHETAVVIDPPRKGCTPEFLTQLAAFGPQRVVYVSCDPATQVRDLRMLDQSGYRLEDVQPFDLFPHTRHLECVMTLARG